MTAPPSPFDHLDLDRITDLATHIGDFLTDRGASNAEVLVILATVVSARLDGYDPAAIAECASLMARAINAGRGHLDA
jgi:hypothetical protein